MSCPRAHFCESGRGELLRLLVGLAVLRLRQHPLDLALYMLDRIEPPRKRCKIVSFFRRDQSGSCQREKKNVNEALRTEKPDRMRARDHAPGHEMRHNMVQGRVSNFDRSTCPRPPLGPCERSPSRSPEPRAWTSKPEGGWHVGQGGATHTRGTLMEKVACTRAPSVAPGPAHPRVSGTGVLHAAPAARPSRGFAPVQATRSSGGWTVGRPPCKG